MTAGRIGASTSPVLAVRATHRAAQHTVDELRWAGFDLKKVSILARASDADGHAQGFYAMEGRILAWGNCGGFWVSTWGLLAGAAVMVMPPIGIVAAAGPVVAALLGALEAVAVVGGASALVATLTGLGLSAEQAKRHERDLAADRYLVIVHGSVDDVARARAILAAPNRSAWDDTGWDVS